MNNQEFDFNLESGEFSADTFVVLKYNGTEVTVPAVVSKKYARKEVDGRFTTDLPTYTLTVLIARSLIPESISEEAYRYITVIVDGISYAVRYITGTGFVSFTLKPISDAEIVAEEIV